MTLGEAILTGNARAYGQLSDLMRSQGKNYRQVLAKVREIFTEAGRPVPSDADIDDKFRECDDEEARSCSRRVMKPHWPDLCDHSRPRDRFLGSFQNKGLMHDVHVYQDNSLASKPDMHLCIRYGALGDMYLSPGNAENFVSLWDGRADAPGDYKLALPLVMEWLKKERMKDDG
jgi:hypothetical protein